MNHRQPSLIRAQARLVRKHVAGADRMVVCANSNSRRDDLRVLTAALRADCNVTVNRRPAGTAGEHHASGLHHLLRTRRPSRVLILDQDCFPVRPTRILHALDEWPAVGVRQSRPFLAYPWPGMLALDLDRLGAGLCFDPLAGVADTGGRLGWVPARWVRHDYLGGFELFDRRFLHMMGGRNGATAETCQRFLGLAARLEEDADHVRV